MAGDGSTRV